MFFRKSLTQREFQVVSEGVRKAKEEEPKLTYQEAELVALKSQQFKLLRQARKN